MNKPVEYDWTNDDIIEDYELYKDKKAVAKRYEIPVSTVTKILKDGGLDVQKRG